MVFIQLLVGLFVILVCLRIKISPGISVLLGGLVIWLMCNHNLGTLFDSLVSSTKDWRTWDIEFCLYFVMCLEAQLRLTGIFKELVVTLRNLFSSNKVTLAVIPALLGLLPSVGGARFSAPIVAESAHGIDVSKDDQAVINYWFRHIFEFASPMVPGLILACAIANVNIGDVIVSLFWLSVFCAVSGWFYLVSPLKITDPKLALRSGERIIKWSILFLTLGPILLTFILTLAFKLSTSLALAISVLLWFFLLHFLGHKLSVTEVLKSALNIRLIIDVFCIMTFIHILTGTGFLGSIEEALNAMNWSPEVVIAALGFLSGMLTGMTQGCIAITMPVAAVLMPGNLTIVGIALVFGMAGQMLTPTHMCALISVDYFKADVWVFAKKNIVLVAAMCLVYVAWLCLRGLIF